MEHVTDRVSCEMDMRGESNWAFSSDSLHSSIARSNGCHANGSADVTHIKRHLQNVLWYLHDARVTKLTRDTHPGVGRGHGVAQLLDRDDDGTVRNH